MYRTAGKRAADIVLAVLLLILTAPVALGIAFCLAFTSSGRVLFCQTRIGRDSRPFTIYKFCTMRPCAPASVPTRDLPDPASLITPLGRVLRSTSLDELPQLWNVLRGEMSLVGPRPVVPCETELLAARRVLGADQCHPGITGLAQVRGRARLSDAAKAAYDAEYAHTFSLRLDCRILAETFRCVLRRENIDHSASFGQKEPPQSAKRA